MYNLLTLLNAADSRTIQESNNQAIDYSLAFQRAPSLVAGVANTASGPPTAGQFYQYQTWVDGLCAIWLCTVSGSPGTWVQSVASATLRELIAA